MSPDNLQETCIVNHPPADIHRRELQYVHMTARPVLLLCIVILLVSVGCSKPQSTPATASASEPKPAAAPDPRVQQVAALNDVPSDSDRNSIDGNKVMQYVKEVVAIGSRPVGSPGHAKLEQLIHSKLKGDQVEDDAFTAQTPAGSFKMDNIIAKFPGKKDGIIVVAGHYDTNYPLPKSYVGANDGGSSTALLLALADYFRSKPPRVTACGCSGPTAKKHSSDGARATACTAPSIWRKSGKRMAPRNRSRRSCWST